MRCDECGSIMRETCAPITEVVRGVEVTIDDVKHYVCDRCGNIVMDIDSAELLSRKQFDAVSHSKGLLSPNEIRRTRKKLGLTQKEFERLLGVSSPTVSRWETGAMLPSKVACNLIRVLSDSTDAFELLSADRHGLRFDVQAAPKSSMPAVQYRTNHFNSSGKVGTAA